jgi:large repetitive protein
VPSALPMPTVTGQTDITETAFSLLSKNDFGAILNRSAPTVVADPVNPNKLVAVWVASEMDIQNTPREIKGPVVEGAYSADGGKTWKAMPWRSTSADVPDPFNPSGVGQGSYGPFDPRNELLRDPAREYVGGPNKNTLEIYGQWIEPSVAFDRKENFYIVSTQIQQSATPGSITDRAASGAIVLQKFSFAGGGPVRQALASTLTGDNGSPTPPVETKVLYQWTKTDPAMNPVIVVDSNLRSYTDPKTGAVQLDPTVDATSGLGPIYIAWSTVNKAPFSINPDPYFNPNVIKVLASPDGGNSFSSQVYVNQQFTPPGTIAPNPNEANPSNDQRDLVPQIAVSQGTAPSPGKVQVPGGQVNLVWHNSNPAVMNPVPTTVNSIVTNAIPLGGGGLQFNGETSIIPAATGYSDPTKVGHMILDATTDKSGQSHPQTTTFNDTVSFTPAQSGLIFTKLDVTLAIVHPHVNQLLITLSHTDPVTGKLTTVTLVENAVDASGTAFKPAQGLADNGSKDGIGAITYKDPSGMVISEVRPVGAIFDDQAPRLIDDQMNTAEPYTQLNAPPGHPYAGGPALASHLSDFLANGATTASHLSGMWTLSIEDFRSDGTMTPLQFVAAWSLDFTTGMKLRTPTPAVVQPAGSDPAPRDPFPMTPTTLSSPAPLFAQPVGATPVIASDNTLGSFSQFQGRLYLAYTGVGQHFDKTNTPNDTDIFLLKSDDGGASWQFDSVVNDDSPNDGFSAGNRPQFEPQVAVDQTTGTVVVSFLDERYDAAQKRPATFVGASIDGGQTFAPETYLNTPVTALDAIKDNFNAPIALEPIPSNAKEELAFGLGNRQGLAVAGGKIVALWSGNRYQDLVHTGTNGLPDDLNNPNLDIWSGTASISAGPRIINADMGPIDDSKKTINGIVYNNTFAPTTSGNAGTRRLDGILVTFDRPVDISSFTKAQVHIGFLDPNGTTPTDVSSLVTSVVPANAGPFGPRGVGFAAGTQILATQFLIRLTPNGSPGAYSYSVGPIVRDDIRQAADLQTAAHGAQGNLMDQDSKGQDLTDRSGTPDPADAFYAPNPVNPTVGGLGSQAPYDPATLPLIIPGPHVVDSFVLSAQPVLPVRSITRVGNTATVTTVGPHGYTTGQRVEILGADQPQYDGIFTITVTSTTTFTYTVSGNPLPTATGKIFSVNADRTSASDTNNLVLNNTLNFIDVVFDRDMNPATFTTADVLRIVSPAGTLTGAANPFTVTPDPNPHVPRLINGVVTAAADPDPTNPRTFRIGFGTQVLSGTYTVTLASTIASKSGLQLDTNLNAGLDKVRDTPSAKFTPITFTAGGSKIPAGTTTAFALTIPNNATNNFANEGVSVQLNISDPQDKDLRAALMDPNGNMVQLFTHVPVPTPSNPNALGADFLNTIFDDNATSPIADATNPPFLGSYNPQAPLSVLTGKSIVGTWQLIITNDAPAGQSSRDGTLNGWSLILKKPNPQSGIGEPVADQATVSFRIFTMDPTNPLSHSTWTAVGPAGINGGFNSSTVTDIQVDPSDPSGNTVYAATEAGGVWKTRNFLTTNSFGPTWVPLTDFGPGFSINIGSIALLPRNGDPNQTVVYAATGAGTDSGTIGLGSTLGVGIMRSLDGGSTWTLEDSRTNVDANNVPLGINSPSRDHQFVGLSAFKVLVDPRIGPSGQATVYAAFVSNFTGTTTSTGNGGIYKSIDSGKHWFLISDPKITGTDPTDMIFAAGHPDTLYAAFLGTGTFVSHSGSSFTPMAGSRGGDPLILSNDDDNLLGLPSVAVATATNPNGAGGRITLAVPAPTGIPQQDLIYQNWLYAAVITSGNTFAGLYVTKDGGQVWTHVQIPDSEILNLGTKVDTGVPTNDDSLNNNADIVANQTGSFGNIAISLAVDPLNPSVVYIGGETYGEVHQPDQPQAGLIRVDTTGMFDAYAIVPQNNHANDGGQFLAQTVGSFPYDLEETSTTKAAANFSIRLNPTANQSITQNFLNMQINPFNYFAKGASTVVNELLPSPGIENNGDNIAGWKGIGEFASLNFGSEGQHIFFNRIVSMVDPLTGHARLLIADSQGLFTAVDAGDGTELTTVGGTLPVVNGSRTGNMQATQFNGGATQPSILAADIAQALFYGNTRHNGSPNSSADILTTGEIDWSGPQSGSGTGVVTDQTGTGYVYNFNAPVDNGFGGVITDFLDATPPPGSAHPSRTTGLFLTSVVGPEGPDPKDWPGLNSFNLAISPIVPTFTGSNPPSPNQRMVVSSATGNVFRTVDGGNNWFLVGAAGTSAATSDLDGTNAQALAYGAPDPSAGVNPLGQPDDFIYAGTVGGHIYVTFLGGGQHGSTKWPNLSQGLDTSPVQAIAANPHPGSHQAFAVTEAGHVYLMPDAFADQNGGGSWQNITGNLPTLIDSLYGNSTAAVNVGAEFLYSLAVDWRTATPTLYVGGESGVFRSLDMGKTWTVFPSVAQDGAIADGGFLPHVRVIGLSLSLGNIDPTRAIPNQATGPDLLVAYTDGRGAFAIRLANTLHNGPAVTSITPQVAGGSVSAVTVLFNKTVDPSSFTAVPDIVFKGPNGAISTTVSLAPPTQSNPNTLRDTYIVHFAPQSAPGTYTMTIGPDVRDYTGAKMDQDNDGGITGQLDDSFTGTFKLGALSRAVAAPTAAVKSNASSPLLVTEQDVAGAAQFMVFAAGSSTPLFSLGASGGGAVLVHDGKNGAELGTVRPTDARFLDEVMAAAAQGAVIPEPGNKNLHVHSFAPTGALLDEFFTDFDGLVGSPLTNLKPKA